MTVARAGAELSPTQLVGINASRYDSWKSGELFARLFQVVRELGKVRYRDDLRITTSRLNVNPRLELLLFANGDHMSIEYQGVNHVCLVVRDRALAESFYMDILGLKRHRKVSSWFILSPTSTLHLVTIPEAELVDSLFHEIQHVALQVANLRNALSTLLQHERKCFQMDFNGNVHNIEGSEDPLQFGLGTVFTRDPDGNLIEFLQIGHGIFQGEYIDNRAAS